jgi:uncharacterized protein
MVHFCWNCRADIRHRGVATADLSLPSDPVFYIIATLAVILVGLAKGGFVGMGAACMPILTLVIDPVRGAAILLPILLVQDVVGVWSFRKTWDRSLIKVMLPGALAGIALGWWFAASVDVGTVQGLVGVIAILFGANRLLDQNGLALKLSGTLPDWLGYLFGAISGFTSQVAHAGGPPFQLWAIPRKYDREMFAGTSAIFFAVVNWAKVPAYAGLGQFTRDNLTLSVLLLPVAIASTFAGVALVRRVPVTRFYTIIYVLMILVGLKLVQEAWL